MPSDPLTIAAALRAHTAAIERRLETEERPEHISEDAWAEALGLVFECLWESEAGEVVRLLEGDTVARCDGCGAANPMGLPRRPGDVWWCDGCAPKPRGRG